METTKYLIGEAYSLRGHAAKNGRAVSVQGAVVGAKVLVHCIDGSSWTATVAEILHTDATNGKSFCRMVGAPTKAAR